MGNVCTRESRCTQSAREDASARALKPPNKDGSPGSTSSVEVAGPDVGLCNLLLEPVGAQTSEHWAYVGPGRGGYEKIARSNVVGTGSGGHKKDVTTQSSCRVLRFCCTALVFGAGLASLYVLRDPITQVFSHLATSNACALVDNRGRDAAEELSGGSFMRPLRWVSYGKNRFNCSGDAEARGQWPLAQRHWCCKNQAAECSADKAKHPVSVPSTTSTSDAAREPHVDCKGRQSPEFNDWCCSHHGDSVAALSTGPPAPPRPAEKARNSAAEAGAGGEEQAWPGSGDKARVKLEGCDTLCEYQGQASTCRFRIQWAATHDFLWRPDACRQGYEAVLRMCPSCSSCALAGSGCVTPAPTTRQPTTSASLGGSVGTGP